MGIREALKRGQISKDEAKVTVEAWRDIAPKSRSYDLMKLWNWINNYKKSNSDRKIVVNPNKKESKKQRRRRFRKMRQQNDI